MAENLKSFCTKVLVKLPQDQGKDLTFTLFSVEDLNDVRGEVRLGCFPSSLALGRDGNNQGSGQLIGDIITSSLRSVPRALIHHRHPGGTWFHSFLSLFFPCKKCVPWSSSLENRSFACSCQSHLCSAFLIRDLE